MKTFAAPVQTALDAKAQPTFATILYFQRLGDLLTNWSKAITLGSATYLPTPFVITGISENLLTEVPAAQLRITSLAGVWQARVAADTIRGDVVQIAVVYLAAGVWTVTGYQISYTCDLDAVDSQGVTIRLGSSDAVAGTLVPRRSTQESGCQHDYKRGGCPYRGPIATCDRSYDGANGCKSHFPDLELETGKAWTSASTGTRIVQPKPYGAFLGGTPHRVFG